MKFEIRYPTGAIHQVDFPGALVSLGRDPGCDIVLNDAKCSRRHAVIEEGSSGLSVRDSGSANGVFLNGRKVERANLEDGDLLRMGEVIIKVVSEDESAGTVVVGPDDLVPPPPAEKPRSMVTTEVTERPPGARAGPPPQAKTPSGPLRAVPASGATTPGAELRGPIPRPLTVSVLAILAALGGLAFVVSGVSAAVALQGSALGWGLATAGLVLAAVTTALAFGLWSRRSWARPMQIVLAALSMLACPFLPAALTTLIYMLRSEVRAAFSGGKDLADLAPADAAALRTGAAETAFSLSILGMVLLGVVLTGILAWLNLRGAPLAAP